MGSGGPHSPNVEGEERKSEKVTAPGVTKLVALKKAYADIILNTAKEAAARLMVSERKAMRFQQELVSTKDEALRMLLRLKQMFDSKVKESELTSLNQQKKIDELEAQLQEAEEIVGNLRAELRETENKLESVINHQMHPPIDQNIVSRVPSQENCLRDDRLDPYDGPVYSIPDSQVELVSISDTNNPTINGTSDSSKFCVTHDHANNCYIHNPDFASIVIRRKEPELYRNGCTQRIRAFERSLFDGNISVSGNLDNVHDENENLVRVHEESKAMPITTNAKAETICEKEKLDQVKVAKADVDSDKFPAHKSSTNSMILRDIIRATKRCRARYLANAKNPPCVSDNNDSSRVNSSMVGENEAQKGIVRVHEGKAMNETTNAKADTICGKEKADKLEVVRADVEVVKASVHKKSRHTMRLLPDPVKKTNETSYPSDVKGSLCVLDNNDPSRVDSSMVCEKEARKDLMSPSFANVLTDETATTKQSDSRDDIEKGGAFLNACSARNKSKDDKELLDKSDLTRQESLSTESLEVPSCRADAELANGSPDKLDPKASDLDEKVSSQPAKDKFLKYTFSRKRKKSSVSSADADCSLENHSLEKSGEKQNGYVEPQKSCPVTESSRDGRRLAQVARQLISLSEKKRWQ
ncbi:hypothetical protein RIF29_06981 [Crotalaria pallida]|uniref:Uncharacterized protein n=1 Tax=Crotalaria pallida TaxID=3830 RepID=A0AAN9J4V2_CROPI